MVQHSSTPPAPRPADERRLSKRVLGVKATNYCSGHQSEPGKLPEQHQTRKFRNQTWAVRGVSLGRSLARSLALQSSGDNSSPNSELLTGTHAVKGAILCCSSEVWLSEAIDVKTLRR